ncbi:MAG: hypothetical protein SFT93_00440 [Rickettsiaceae bacterium]|nr:hypothetical protein [Rickettsiaceae bacterium]
MPLDSRLRGNDSYKFSCHPRENGDPGNIILLDSRLRGNDKRGDGNDSYDHSVIPSKEGI